MPLGARGESGGGIPRLRDPTRQNTARKKKSGRCARDDKHGFGTRGLRGEKKRQTRRLEGRPLWSNDTFAGLITA